jgi:phosphomannomutase
MDGLKEKPIKSVLGRTVVEVNPADGYKFICDDGSWLLIRLSGTEPKLRIYSETSSSKRSVQYIKAGKDYAFSLF